MSILKIDLADQNSAFLKVLTVTVIDDENGFNNIHQSLVAIDQGSEEESKAYHSEEESHTCSKMRDELSSDKRSSYKQGLNNLNVSRSPSMKKANVPNNTHLRLSQNLMHIQSLPSNQASDIRIDRIEQFKSVESSVEGKEEIKLIKKNVSDRGLYLSSQRVMRTVSYRDKLYSTHVPKFVLSKRESLASDAVRERKMKTITHNIRDQAYVDYKLNLQK